MGGVGYRLILVSGVSPLNDNCAGVFKDQKTAFCVAGLLMALDRMDSPEYKSFVVDEVNFAILRDVDESGQEDIPSLW
jgi:hypothetical protein